MKIFQKILLNSWTALITLGIVISIVLSGPVFLESVKLRYFDQLITNQQPVDNHIYTINIDEDTLEKYGQWPFKRDIYAQIIEELYSHNAGIVVWNIMMPEGDRLGGDDVLAETLKKYPVILSNTIAEKTKNSPKKPGSAVIGSENIDTIYNYPGIIANIPKLEANAAGVGLTYTLPEVDGVNRRLPLFAAYEGNVYPSLPLEVLRVVSNDTTFQLKLNENGVEKMRIPNFNPILTDSLGQIWVDYSQKSTAVSAVNLPKDFSGAIVIVGTTAAGLGNPVPTSLGSVWPHELQAAVLGTLANGINIERPDWAPGLETLTLLVIGIMVIGLSRWTYAGLAFGALTLLSLIPISIYLFDEYKFLIDAIVPTIGGGIVMLHTYGVKFINEFLQKQQIKKQFGTYLSPDLVAQLQRNPDLLRLGGTKQDLTIMFTDVRGFTTISEHYGEDVEGLTSIMNRYMTAMTRKILENKGTLDKYIGDAQMAFWNAPIEDSNHAVLAVRTGLEMMESLNAVNKEISAEGIPPFGMGLGINTGPVVVGNMGSEQRFDYTCLGDAVNLASRLEGQSKPYGVKMVLGPRTAELVKDHFELVELDCIAVKGKTVGVKIYTVGHTVKYKHQEFLKSYYHGDWNRAKKLCFELKENYKTDLAEYYEKMLERLNEGLPPNWDGVYRATSK